MLTVLPLVVPQVQVLAPPLAALGPVRPTAPVGEL
jgi:hypothetical protein